MDSSPHPSSALDVRQILHRSWLRDASDEIVAAVATTTRTEVLADGELLFARGDPGDGLYVVVSGAVSFSRATREGKSSMISLLEPVTWFGELSGFDGLPRTHDARAVGATVLLHHGVSDLDRIFARYPELHALFTRLLSLRVRLMYDWLEEASVLSLPARLARKLLALTHGDGVDAMRAPRPVPLSQEALGEVLGASRQSIAKYLALWEESGWVAPYYGGVFVRDRTALARIGQAR